MYYINYNIVLHSFYFFNIMINIHENKTNIVDSFNQNCAVLVLITAKSFNSWNIQTCILKCIICTLYTMYVIHYE